MRWLSFVILGGAFGLLVLLWGHVPDSWVSHWNASGQPDGWTHKNLFAAASPLLIGAAAVALVEAVGRWSISKAKLAPELTQVLATTIRIPTLGIATFISVITIALPLLHPDRPGALVFTGLGLLLASVVLAFRWSRRQMRGLAARGVEIPEGWDGLIYRNSNDPRIWVPKLGGLGHTLNFAHPASWWILAALLLPGAVVLGVTMFAVR